MITQHPEIDALAERASLLTTDNARILAITAMETENRASWAAAMVAAEAAGVDVSKAVERVAVAAWHALWGHVERTPGLTRDEVRAAEDVARVASRVAGDAALALSVRHLAGTGKENFTHGDYRALVRTWVRGVGRIHPDDPEF